MKRLIKSISSNGYLPKQNQNAWHDFDCDLGFGASVCGRFVLAERPSFEYLVVFEYPIVGLAPAKCRRAMDQPNRAKIAHSLRASCDSALSGFLTKRQ